MGIWNLLIRKQAKVGTITNVVFGEDKTLWHRQMDATGFYFFDQSTLLGYDSFPESIGTYIHTAKQKEKYLGQTSVLFEPMARPFSFASLSWVDEKRLSEKSVILESGRSEGYAKAVRDMDIGDRFDRMSTILLIMVALVGIMALLFVIQSGVLKDLIGKIGG